MLDKFIRRLAIKAALVPGVRQIVTSWNRRELARFASLGEQEQALVDYHAKALAQSTKEESPLDAIARERSRLSGINDLLDQGDFGPAAPWDEGVTVADACSVSIIGRHARYMYWLIRELRPKKVLELGTNVGVSGAHIAAALQNNRDGGRLVTMEGSPYRQRVARGLFENAGLDNADFVLGMFDDTFDSAVAEYGPFDMAFIDGNHQRDPTLHYTRTVCDQSPKPTWFVFDDIRWSPGMTEAWAELRKDPRMLAGLDLGGWSVCLMGRDSAGPPNISGELYSIFSGT